jgi:hypothetical protein
VNEEDQIMGRPRKNSNQEQRRRRLQKRNRAIRQRRRAGISVAAFAALKLEVQRIEAGQEGA